MSNENKIKVTEWISFAISCLSIVAKFVKEIVEQIPTKGE